MLLETILPISLAFYTALAQQPGSVTVETHPRLTWQKCTLSGGCTTIQGSIVMDANWRWIHKVGDYKNCYTGNSWDATICSNNTACADNCALEGADYAGTYGITTSGNALTLRYMRQSLGTANGIRVFLLENDTKYQMFNLLNQEFTFDVDTSKLGCGLNGAVYFAGMDSDGGMSRFNTNKAGAKYGTGYCDSRCPRDLKFINGEANAEGWTASSTDTYGGTGRYGSCCPEMDVWEANKVSTVFAPHPCDDPKQARCDGTACGGTSNRYGSSCDPDGCDFNPYRMGNRVFYGPGMTIDTTQKMTVVTQFLTNLNTTSGTLTEIRRLYVQNGRVIQNSKVNIPGMKPFDSITDAYCTELKTTFKETDSFSAHGGLYGMGKAMAKQMVLVLSIDDDPNGNMLWLDSSYPIETDPSLPGVIRGSCATSSGRPSDIESSDIGVGATVTYSNIRFGDIGSTFYVRT